MPPIRPMEYFNEWERFPSRWLMNLYPRATVDGRDIRDVSAADLRGYRRVHMFAGIGGWEYALELAGWPPYREVWTGSCPCQPFSTAGSRKGFDDERHLWPSFFRLISQCRPPTVFGEQVAGESGLEWLTGVQHDMESIGYAVGSADLAACSVGSPHRRNRLYWVAHSCSTGCKTRNLIHIPGRSGLPSEPGVSLGGPAHPHGKGPQGLRPGEEPRELSPWGTSFDVVRFTDGATRRIEPGTLPLAHGVPNRVGRISAYGNAIVPQVTALFIKCFLRAEEDMRCLSESRK